MTDEPAYRLVRTARPEVAAPVLDAAQQAVVDHSGGPLLVLAGPGTGKTTTLVEAVVDRVVRRAVPIEHQLLLTFSRRAAGQLRDRVAARLRGTVREPVARTLHSYAFGVLRMANAARGLPAPRLLSAPEQDIVLRELLEGRDASRWPAQLRPALRTHAFAGELRDLLMRAVERGLDGEALAALGRERHRADWVAAGEFLTEYHDVYAMKDPGAYDTAELVRAALNALHDDPALLAAERARRRRIFVDEYQDTDPGQAQLLQLLADGADELVLVGDPDQSIYAFRGADESAIRSVDERFGAGRPVPVLALNRSRRSGAQLLAATRRIADRLPGRAEQRAIVAAGGLPPGRADVAVFRTASEEAAYIAGVLRVAHLDGLPWDEMAVLVRSTASTLGVLRRAMITAGVPVTVRGDDLPVAEQPAVELLLTLLECVVDAERLDETVAEALLVGPLGGGDALYLRRLRRELRRSFPDEGGRVSPAVADEPGARQLPHPLERPVARVARALAAGRAALATGASTESVLWALWQSTALEQRWERASLAGGVAGSAADRDLDAVLELFETAADFTDRLPGAEPLLFLDHVRAQQIPGGALAGARPAPAAVSVLTAHASKGLEWDLVCVAAVQEGTWPDLRRRGSLLGTEALVDAVRGIDLPATAGGLLPGQAAAQLTEERRLFYVAATRARRRLVVTAVAGDGSTGEQPSRLLDELDPVETPRRPALPIRGVHLPGLVAELRAVVCADPGEVGERERLVAAAELARLAAAGVRGADPDDWWGLAPLSTTVAVAEPDRPVPVSPSRVESFLTCELRTLMQGFGVQDDEAVAASLGTLVHDLASRATDDQPLAEFERQLHEVWDSIDFGASWFATNEKARATEMLERLVGWLRESRATLTRIAVEQDFSVPVGDAVITGRVDRLERDTDDRLVVVDLKTGKSKPKADELAELPQLGVYQLAVEQGAFGADATEAGGALLVQLGARGPTEQRQPPLARADDPQWARAAVDLVAERMRGSEFTARQNQRCQVCDVRGCCPLQIQGRQVPS